jgi:uncharacterized protein (DUF488 family)
VSSPRTASRGERVVYTVGHSHHSLEHLLSLLREHEIELLIDVRSRPGARHAPHFNKNRLEGELASAPVDYLWLGEKLGGRPDDEQLYDSQGYALYEPMSKQEWFMKAIGQAEYEAERRPTALLCLEEPERCHRYHLLGKLLAQRELEVLHIRRDGVVETQAQVAERVGEGQIPLIGEVVWKSVTPQRFPDDA